MQAANRAMPKRGQARLCKADKLARTCVDWVPSSRALLRLRRSICPLAAGCWTDHIPQRRALELGYRARGRATFTCLRAIRRGALSRAPVRYAARKSGGCGRIVL